MSFATPYYLIDEARLLRNLKLMQYVRETSGAKTLLALKCFATWSVFDLMRDYMDGTTSSSLYEVKLGAEKFGKETHAYSVAYAAHEIDDVLRHADKIIFNSISQLKQFETQSQGCPRGLRINPNTSTSAFLLADPARPYSRLGVFDPKDIETVLPLLSGFMIHFNCENNDFSLFDAHLTRIEHRFGYLFHAVDWISLGGGLAFTDDNYPIDKFCARLKDFSEKWGLQVYLEPGEASITQSASLETTVLDILENGKSIAVVDASIEAHMLDLLTYETPAKITPNQGAYSYLVCGKSCLAGDIFGEFHFEQALKIGDRIAFDDAAGYTMVKKNWFNGLTMPSIVVRRLDGREECVQKPTYEDYINSLS